MIFRVQEWILQTFSSFDSWLNFTFYFFLSRRAESLEDFLRWTVFLESFSKSTSPKVLFWFSTLTGLIKWCDGRGVMFLTWDKPSFIRKVLVCSLFYGILWRNNDLYLCFLVHNIQGPKHNYHFTFIFDFTIIYALNSDSNSEPIVPKMSHNDNQKNIPSWELMGKIDRFTLEVHIISQLYLLFWPIFLCEPCLCLLKGFFWIPQLTSSILNFFRVIYLYSLEENVILLS